MNSKSKIKGKRILIIGGGLLQVPIIQTAKAMEIQTIVVDMNPEAPGFEYSDEKLVISTKDVEGVVRELKKISRTKKIDGVITAGTDASKTVAAVANALGLPGIRYVDAEAASNKVKMRERLRKANVPIPNFYSVWNISDIRESLNFLQFPLVVKPSENMGARGVMKVSHRDEIHKAFKHAKQYSPTGEMIIEEYMEGPELSVDALTWNGNYKITGIADRIIEKEPFFVEMGHNMPSSFDAKILLEAKKVMIDGMKALGITHGAGKGDLKVTKNGIMVGEIAARLSGGFMSAYTYPLSSGVNLNKSAILIALGEDPDDLEEKFHKVSIERSLIAPRGKLLKIEGIEEAKKIKGVNDIFLFNSVGDIIREPTNNIEKTAHVIITADSLEEAERAFDQTKNTIRFTSDELHSISEKEINANARIRFGKDVCWVCKVCDGTDCASGVPGMGGIGRMVTFQDNILALKEYSIIPRYIRENVQADTGIEFLGHRMMTPMMSAPLTGAVTNMKGAVDEYTYAVEILKGSQQSGSIGWLGDGSSPDKYLIMLNALKTVEGMGVLICKPRQDIGMIRERFLEAQSQEIFALGMDIDAVNFKTMVLQNQESTTRKVKELSKIRNLTSLPFILKGIVTVEDAELAVEAGVDCIVVSNHGGRVLDDMPGTARVLPLIQEKVKGKIHICVDGGIRSGMDIFKMIGLGADSILVGRPLAIAAVGGGIQGVRFLYNQYNNELLRTMNTVGTATIKDIDQKYLFNKALERK